jgi:hypothetical protein
MVQSSSMSLQQLQTFSELLHGADWALAHGDLGTLGNVATLLQRFVAVPLRTDLQVVIDLSGSEPDVAILKWVTTRASLHAYLCVRAEGLNAKPMM